MKPILKWQYDRLVKELLLLQDHLSDPSCPCETEDEMCVRKHLYSIEAYAEETVAIEDDDKRKTTLLEVASSARDHRLQQEKALCGQDVPPSPLEWARDWRKTFESLCLVCPSDEDEGQDESKESSS